jgi:hypothetical protein
VSDIPLPGAKMQFFAERGLPNARAFLETHAGEASRFASVIILPLCGVFKLDPASLVSLCSLGLLREAEALTCRTRLRRLRSTCFTTNLDPSLPSVSRAVIASFIPLARADHSPARHSQTEEAVCSSTCATTFRGTTLPSKRASSRRP